MRVEQTHDLRAASCGSGATAPEPSTIRGCDAELAQLAARRPRRRRAYCPPAPKRAPRPLSSISAAKLSDGTFVARMSSPTGGDADVATGTAPPPALTGAAARRGPDALGPQGGGEPPRGFGGRAASRATSRGPRSTSAPSSRRRRRRGEAGRGAAAQRVEQALVGQDAAGHAQHAAVVDRAAGQPPDRGAVQRRVAGALQVEVAAPACRPASSAAAGGDRRGQPGVGPQPQQRGGGREELVDRRRDARDVLVVGEQPSPGVEVPHVGAARPPPAPAHLRAARAPSACGRPAEQQQAPAASATSAGGRGAGPGRSRERRACVHNTSATLRPGGRRLLSVGKVVDFRPRSKRRTRATAQERSARAAQALQDGARAGRRRLYGRRSTRSAPCGRSTCCPSTSSSTTSTSTSARAPAPSSRRWPPTASLPRR